MRWIHPAHPDRAVRLGYCLNAWPADDLRGVMTGLAQLATPLAKRLGGGRPFGVGMYLPAAAARALRVDAGGAALRRLSHALAESGLDAFTFNAFPFGGFHRTGLKQGVFLPAWNQAERLAFTLDVAEVAVELAGQGAEHLSISTHTGRFGPFAGEAEELAAILNLTSAALELARLYKTRGRRIVLALEAEPGANAGDTAELARFRARLLERAAQLGEANGLGTAEEIARALARHLGTCLDACHAAVEFEPPGEALANATAHGAPLGKLQFTSALSLARPAQNAQGRAALQRFAEPIFLHQVRGRGPNGVLRAGDLPALESDARRPGSGWMECDEWRCHFHVAVDLSEAGGLATTRADADAILAAALAEPARWGTRELHLEIETYTWTASRNAPSPTEMVERICAEYAHVMRRLEVGGWKRA